MKKMTTQLANQPSATINQFDNEGGDGSTREEAPPDGGYGWVCVAACFTINCFTWGTVSVSQCSYEDLIQVISAGLCFV